jgi:hypothetical protein
MAQRATPEYFCAFGGSSGVGDGWEHYETGQLSIALLAVSLLVCNPVPGSTIDRYHVNDPFSVQIPIDLPEDDEVLMYAMSGIGSTKFQNHAAQLSFARTRYLPIMQVGVFPTHSPVCLRNQEIGSQPSQSRRFRSSAMPSKAHAKSRLGLAPAEDEIGCLPLWSAKMIG